MLNYLHNNPTKETCNYNLYLSSDHIYKIKFNYKYTLFLDHQILVKPYISINMTTVTDNEYNEIGAKTEFKIDEIIKVIEVGNHIQFQSQHYFLVNDYQSRISSEIANFNEALENICRILLEQSSEPIIKLAGPSSISNNRTTSHSISLFRENEIEDNFSGQPEPGIHSGPAQPELHHQVPKSTHDALQASTRATSQGSQQQSKAVVYSCIIYDNHVVYFYDRTVWK